MLKSRLRKWLIVLLLPTAMLALAACGESDRDETAPTITAAVPPSPQQADAVALSGTIEEGATLEVRLNDTLLSGLPVTAGTWAGEIGGLQEGNNLLVLTAVDAAGNTNSIQLVLVRDNAAPTIQSTSPVAGAADVPVASTLTLVFSEAVNAESLEANFTLVDENANAIPVVLAYTPGTTIATFAPVGLSPATTYSATVAAGVEDLAGNSFALPFIFTFTTLSE